MSRSAEPAVAPADAEQFCGMVGESPAIQCLFARIRRIAFSPAAVLVVGETGTGKELVARAVHRSGPRAARPFVAVNCAALSRDLIESELFGHVRGAFSGAGSDHTGLVRAAAGGTLLLDEISEMAPDLQAKLLRVLQERAVRPVGAVLEVPVDVRIIASTNRDPAAAMQCGLLRADLYYRLSANLIGVPPLRERGDDVALLVAHYLAVLNERCHDVGPSPRGISPESLTLLRTRSWPGNVRELFNVIEGGFMVCQTAEISADDLGVGLHAPSPHSAIAPERYTAAADTLADGERAIINRTLALTGGNKRRAAHILGISRKKLYAKLAKYSLTMA